VTAFGTYVSKQLDNMGAGLDDMILLLGSAHVISKNRIKRADKTFVSRKLPRNQGRKWPSLSVEVGYSDSPRKLAEDARWWIEESEDEVRDVITIELDKARREMNVSQWRVCGLALSLVYIRLHFRETGHT
jgi:hypothetical protein